MNLSKPRSFTFVGFSDPVAEPILNRVGSAVSAQSFVLISQELEPKIYGAALLEAASYFRWTGNTFRKLTSKRWAVRVADSCYMFVAKRRGKYSKAIPLSIETTLKKN
jgi:hypothetical protein